MASSALLGERIARHGFVDRASTTARAASGITTAIQAQDNYASRLGLRARTAALTEADVQRAIDVDRTIVRTWLMRGTIHLVDAADARWLVRLIGPVVARKYRTRWRQIGLTDVILQRTIDALPGVLAGGPLTRHEIRDALARQGMTIDSSDPQAHTHVLLHASTTGLICRGPDRGRHSTFVLTDDWLPGAPVGPSGDDALAELARRYFTAYSPATAADFATWAGLPSGRAVELIRDELTDVDVDGRPGFRRGQIAPGTALRLLPAFDNYVLGYRDRSAMLHPDRHLHVYQGGMIRPTVLLDGAVIGTWALDRAKARLTVTPFEPLPTRVASQVERDAADVSRFVGRELRFEIAAAAQP